ncbi:hypothetical protein [Microbulbifer sp. JTAC008]|uniref:hypothetical protein n=1 Tax=unclassified Microbulbifer TaxID=2619833 RepID=UPI00403A73E1
MLKKLSAFVLLFGFSAIGHSETIATTVEELGCYSDKEICFAYVSTDLPSGTCVSNNSLRWNGITDEYGKALLSILLTAQASNQTVVFNVSGCYENRPTFEWAKIKG